MWWPLWVFARRQRRVKSGKVWRYTNRIKDTKQDTQNQDCEKDETDSDEESEPTLGRQLRNRTLLQKPKRFEDHIMEAESYVNENNYPYTYEEAINAKDSTNWKKAMNAEMNWLKESQTWKLTDLPVRAKAIPCKWVYSLKTHPDGSIDKYKARLVLKGLSQREGIDFSETYSPVAKLGTIRAILSIAAEEKMHLTQVCRLKRSLYGLKQSPHCWNKCFGKFLTDLGFKESQADPCLNIREREGRKLLIVLYVDDGLIVATDQQDSEMFIKELKQSLRFLLERSPAS